MNSTCRTRCLETKTTGTFVVDEDVSIKAVSEQQDVLRVFKVDVRSGEQVRIEAVEGKRETDDPFWKQKKEEMIFVDSFILFTSDQLEKTQNSRMKEEDWAAPPAAPLTNRGEVFESPPVINQTERYNVMRLPIYQLLHHYLKRDKKQTL